ncbi:MAG TPA: hypothetical protein V6C63_13415, partial [Allocoleopsis sp.]
MASGEICDILAVDDHQGLAILELKNVEDRYLIQQLTRYYANLVEEQPFQQDIDYSRPIRLIAIAPSYHRHNVVDSEYSKLEFELLQFSVIKDENGFHLLLQQFEKEFAPKQYPIAYQEIETPEVDGIPEIPELLVRWLGGCTREEQEGFLRLRSKLLSCSPRMKEIVDKRVIQYGSGKTRLCAEIYFQRKSQRPILFLWLPTPTTYLWSRAKRVVVGRLRIWTDGKTISHVGHVAEGFGRMKTQEE